MSDIKGKDKPAGDPPADKGNGKGGGNGGDKPPGPTTVEDDQPTNPGNGGDNGHGNDDQQGHHNDDGTGYGNEEGNGGGNGGSQPPPTGGQQGDDLPGQSDTPDEQPASLPRIEAVVAALAGVTFPVIVTTTYGVVRVLDIRVEDNGVGTVPWVEVYIEGPGETHFRIFNPPTMVEDPEGPITDSDGRHYRLDPIKAIVESVIIHGGKS